MESEENVKDLQVRYQEYNGSIRCRMTKVLDSQYELKRQAMIQENQKLLRELGLVGEDRVLDVRGRRIRKSDPNHLDNQWMNSRSYRNCLHLLHQRKRQGTHINVQRHPLLWDLPERHVD